MSTGNIQLWTQIETFVGKNWETKNRDFNPYIEAIDLWTHPEKQPEFEENIQTAQQLTCELAEKYESDLQKIASLFVQNAAITDKIKKALENTEATSKLTKERFSIDPKALLQLWKKSLKYQKEVEIINQIEDLVQTPSIATQLIEKGNTLEAVNKLQTSLQVFTDNQQMNFSALSDVKKKLESCKRKITNTIFENLYNELFSMKRPTNFSFFNPKTTENDMPDINIDSIKTNCQALFALEEQNKFLREFKDELPEKFSRFMVDVIKEIKIKSGRSNLETKNNSSTILEKYQNYNTNNQIISYLDNFFCKLWVLLVKCDKIDHFLSDTEKILDKVWKNFSLEMDFLMTSFTSSTHDNGKNQKQDSLTYKFVSESESTSGNKMHNYIRQELGIKPSKFNFLYIYPLFNKFKEIAMKVFKLPNICIINVNNGLLLMRQEIRKYSEVFTKTPVNQRTIKVEGFDAPIFLTTPSFLKNIYHFINSAIQFPFIADDLVKAIEQFITAFFNSCELHTSKYAFNSSNKFYALKILNDRTLAKYKDQPLLKEMIFEGKTDISHTILDQFEEFEIQNEAELWNGMKMLTIEETVRENFQLPLLANVAESLIYFTQQVEQMLQQKKGLLKEGNYKSIKNKLSNANKIILQCFCFIHIEMRCRCYQIIIPNISGQTYNILNATNSHDDYANLFIKMYNSTYETLSHKLTPPIQLFAFINIPKLLFDLHIKYIPRVIDINEKGSQLLANNLVLFNQTFSAFHDIYQSEFRKAFWFASNIYL